MRTRGCLFLSDADQISRRTNDYLLSVPGMHASMEGKLITCSTLCSRRVHSMSHLLVYFIILVCILVANVGEGVEVKPTFSLVLYICVWKRPLLTEFVLSYYDGLRTSLVSEGIQLHMFIVGSENNSTAVLAQRFSTAFAVHPNSPLGAKHDKGIQSLREHFMNEMKEGRMPYLPDAVGVFGSDDIVNRIFFMKLRDLMAPTMIPRSHMVGLRDIMFYDLKSGRLVYTKGYRSFRTRISGTLGCGRVYSWSLLDTVDWHLWDREREHGLDQSATRNVLRKVPMIDEVSVALLGREMGILAVDIKSDGYKSGSNIWKFDQVVEAVGRNGRFHDFDYEQDDSVLEKAFASSVYDRLNALRHQMGETSSE